MFESGISGNVMNMREIEVTEYCKTGATSNIERPNIARQCRLAT